MLKVTQPRGVSPMAWLLHIWVVVIVAVICVTRDGICGHMLILKAYAYACPAISECY